MRHQNSIPFVQLFSAGSDAQDAAEKRSFLFRFQGSRKVNRAMKTSAVSVAFVLLLMVAMTNHSLAVPISTGLALQYDGTDVTTSAGEVLTWHNQGSLAAEGDLTPRVVTARPTLGVGTLNGHNVINFLGRTEEVLRSSLTPFTTPLAQANQLFMVVQHTGANEAVIFDGRDDVAGRNFIQMKNNGNFHLFAGSSVTKDSGAIKNEYKIYTARFDAANSTVHTDGTQTYLASPSSIGTQALAAVSVGNSDPNNSPASLGVNGQIAEVLFYDTPLNSAASRITENYLSSKYNVGSTPAGSDITLGVNDLYAGDLNANGDYDIDVFGIGNDGSSSLTAGSSGGLSLAESGSSMASGEFLLGGHDGTAHDIVDAEGTAGDRWARTYYLDTTGEIDTTITFDFGEAGLTLAQDNASYNLLYSATSGTFSWQKIAEGNVSGDEVQFLLSGALISDGFYTLGIVTPIPEPSSLLLLGFSTLGLLRYTRKHSRNLNREA